MNETLQALKKHLRKARMVAASARLLSWDQETMMPPGGTAIRAEQLGTLQGIYHDLLTDPLLGEMLEYGKLATEKMDYDSHDAALIRHALREYEKRTKVPTDLIVEIYQLAGQAKETWRRARAEDDFSIFEDDLAKMVDLQREKAACFDTGDNPYDALLDDFEPDLSYAYINEVFSALKPRLKELVAAIAQNQDAVDVSVVRRPVPQEQQMQFSREITSAIGYDYQRGRLDLSTHPFTSGTGPGDTRITTRVLDDSPLGCIMAALHEAGHGMHGQNLDAELANYPVGFGSTLAIAESQSRFYENVIGRGRPFWQHFFPRLQELTSPVYDDVSLEDFYKAVNESKPSLIRVEADEVTYGMHIMIRFEIENDLINGRIEAADLPDVWNTKMEEYLGVVPPTDSEGVLQDIHWSQGGFGYFPDYLLGSMFASQLWDKLREDISDVDSRVARGEFSAILEWSAEHVMQHGRKYTFPELTERTVGGFSAEPYVAYLTEKYSEVYEL